MDYTVQRMNPSFCEQIKSVCNRSHNHGCDANGMINEWLWSVWWFMVKCSYGKHIDCLCLWWNVYGEVGMVNEPWSYKCFSWYTHPLMYLFAACCPCLERPRVNVREESEQYHNGDSEWTYLAASQFHWKMLWISPEMFCQEQALICQVQLLHPGKCVYLSLHALLGSLQLFLSIRNIIFIFRYSFETAG